MFNSYSITHGGNVSNLAFNSTSGTLVKSTEKSRIIRFHMNSDHAKSFFDKARPHMYVEHMRHPVVVLQVMLCGGDNFLVEYLDLKED